VSVSSDPAIPLPFAAELPRHAAVVEALRRAVEASEQWRWLELSCSLAAGRGDDLSDVDAGVGYAESITSEDLEREGAELVAAAGPIADLLVCVLPGWTLDTRRLAVEYRSGVQLDLVLLPASRRHGLPDGAVALVDRDGRLAKPWRPPVADPPTSREAREWVMLGWWALSDAAKYLRRGSLYEAIERVGEARQHALRLFAVAERIPYPSFGLVSLLDFEPYELPDSLEQTYAIPRDQPDVLDAATATADLLSRTTRAAAVTLNVDLDTPWVEIARERLTNARHRGS